jgi:uncharacterized protein (TIGR00369 family)
MAQPGYHDALRKHFAGLIPHAVECGLTIERLDDGGALAQVPYRHEWLGDTGRGLIHTGIITTLVDTVSGLAALAATGQFEPIATLDLRMDYLRPALPGQTLFSHAECYRLTRSIAFVRARAWQDDEHAPVAISQSTFMRSSGRKRRAGVAP